MTRDEAVERVLDAIRSIAQQAGDAACPDWDDNGLPRAEVDKLRQALRTIAGLDPES